MDWNYIAGFFDGEGSISFKVKGKTPFYVVCIANTNREILEEIQKFLREKGINSHLYSRPSAQYIYISKQSDMLKFLRRIKPFIFIKLPKAKELIFYLTHKKSRFKINISPKIIFKMYWIDKLSTVQIGKKLNCSSTCVKEFFDKNKIPLRNKSQVASLLKINERTRDEFGRFI